MPESRCRKAAAVPAFIAVLMLELVLPMQAASGADAGSEEAGDASAPLSFKLEVISKDRDVARLLRRNLDIQRFASFNDLQPGELRRLLAEAESNARNLLAAQGYFSPRLELRADEVPSDPGEPRRIAMEVDPGQPTRITRHSVEFAEPMNSDADSAEQRKTILQGWPLRQGERFTQEAWDAAKTGGLRTLRRERYPTARIADSQASIAADDATAEVSVTYDPGAAYRFGELELPELRRYDARGIRNIARIPTGEVYSEAKLLDAQQRLVASGYLDSAFLMLDPDEEDPGHARVQAQVTEAKYQKMVLGVGFSNDQGFGVSVDHSHNKMWPLGWRAVNRVAIATESQQVASRWTDMPNDSGWAWHLGGELERSDYGDYKADTISLNTGRSKSFDRTDRSYYLQYDASLAEGAGGPPNSSSILANFALTRRDFDDRLNPTSGYGFAGEGGVGHTLTPDADPFLRLNVRGILFWPFGEAFAGLRRSRIVLRSELGAIYAADDVDIPVTLLFLTGGGMTVRGYRYQSIGARLPDGTVYGARYLGTGSVEWQQPIRLFGNSESWEYALFADGGTAFDKASDAKLYSAVGTGVRWNSPVGAMQADVAYGIESEDVRLHLRFGFQF